jgi:hypothetical protein
MRARRTLKGSGGCVAHRDHGHPGRVVLLTWNSAHIANAEKRPLVEAVCRQAGYEAPILSTPDELMGEDSSHVDAR